MTPPCHGWDSPGSHHVVPKMRISLSQKYIQNVLGENTLDTFLNVYNANAAIVSYILPWISTFTVMTNMLVSCLCIGIYWKTKRQGHKPAFVFIGFLGLFDVLLGL